MLLLHRQHCLSLLQVCLLQAKKNFAFLQHSAEVGELLRHGDRAACLGEEILLSNIITDTTSVTFYAHLPKRMRRKPIPPPT
jgi:hypothetical protein